MGAIDSVYVISGFETTRRHWQTKAVTSGIPVLSFDNARAVTEFTARIPIHQGDHFETKMGAMP